MANSDTRSRDTGERERAPRRERDTVIITGGGGGGGSGRPFPWGTVLVVGGVAGVGYLIYKGFGSIFGGIGDVASELVNGIGGALSTVAGGVESVAGDIYSGGKSVVNGIGSVLGHLNPF